MITDNVLHDLSIIATAIASIVAALVSLWNHRAIKQVHGALNGRLDEFLRVTRAVGYAQGTSDTVARQHEQEQSK
jgi:hypothetical protein